MKQLLIFLLLFTFLNADEKTDKEHDLYLTLYMPSFHWTKNSATDEEFNDTHKAYGTEYIYDNKYSLDYNHFINSRGKDVDVYGVGYLLAFSESFGLHLIGGYQRGYCFDGLLSSVECTEGKDDTGAFVLPLLYYKHEYFKLDLFTNSHMLGFRFNLKIY